MKKLILILPLLVVLSSCFVPQNTTTIRGKTIDYFQYSKKGFFISEANSVNFEYVPIGSVIASSIAGYRSNEKHSINNTNKVSRGGKSTIKKSREYISPTPEAALKKAYSLAIEKGADGIINLNIKYSPARKIGNVYFSEEYVVTGMLIKRK